MPPLPFFLRQLGEPASAGTADGGGGDEREAPTLGWARLSQSATAVATGEERKAWLASVRLSRSRAAPWPY